MISYLVQNQCPKWKILRSCQNDVKIETKICDPRASAGGPPWGPRGTMLSLFFFLFENKIGCVANLLHFNDGQREILKTASWINLNDMMLSQPQSMTEDEIHKAQWLLVLQTGKNVKTFLNTNKNYSFNELWQEFSKTQGNNTQFLQLIDYMVERCRWKIF